MKRNKPEKFSKIEKKPVDNLIRLNKYLSNSGVTSRRDADNLIQEGLVKVNGNIIRELGYKVNPEDKITLRGKPVSPQKTTYILLNKPKGFISTTRDTHGRKTVMDLIANATTDRVYPVGRLDRDTTGLLLFTNDGELTNGLIHPSKGIEKIYAVDLDKPLTKNDMLAIAEGIELEDGIAQIDEIAYIDDTDKRKIGIRLHSGKNRIVRRIFEHFHYSVEKLDRVAFAMLTKKDLPRGKWRFLTEKEVTLLKRKYAPQAPVEKPKVKNKR